MLSGFLLIVPVEPCKQSFVIGALHQPNGQSKRASVCRTCVGPTRARDRKAAAAENGQCVLDGGENDPHVTGVKNLDPHDFSVF